MRGEQGRQGPRVGGTGVADALGGLGREHLIEVLANIVVGDGPGRTDREQPVEKPAQLDRWEFGQRGGRRERGDVARPNGLGGEVLREADQAGDVGVRGGRYGLRHGARLAVGQQSARSRTDLDAELDRSRYGTEPISATGELRGPGCGGSGAGAQAL